MNTTNVDRLIERYKANSERMTQRELAIAERDIFNAFYATRTSLTGGASVALQRLLGGSERTFRCRYAILRAETMVGMYAILSAETKVGVLWARVDNGSMTIGCAAKLLAKARKNAKTDHVSMSVTFAKVLEEYDGMEHAVSVSTDTGNVRRRSPGRVNPKTMWQKIRKLLAKYVDTQLSEVPEVERKRLATSFENEMEIVFDSYQSKFSIARRSSRKASATNLLDSIVTRKQVLDACETLAIEVPPMGITSNLKAANKAKKQLCAMYHPDKNGGSDHLRENYHSVIDAYSTLERYNEQLGDKVVHLTAIRGGKDENESNHAKAQ